VLNWCFDSPSLLPHARLGRRSKWTKESLKRFAQRPVFPGRHALPSTDRQPSLERFPRSPIKRSKNVPVPVSAIMETKLFSHAIVNLSLEGLSWKPQVCRNKTSAAMAVCAPIADFLTRNASPRFAVVFAAIAFRLNGYHKSIPGGNRDVTRNAENRDH
jgi:hypothetical protein